MVLRYMTESMDWFEQVEGNNIKPFIEKMPFLAMKPMRVYMSRQWKMPKRKKVLLETYFLISRYPALLKAIMQDNGFELACFDSSGSGVMHVVACYKHALKKDGELSILLTGDAFSSDIYKMTISFERGLKGDWICYIGCVQGGIGKEEIKMVTKAMYGVRPCAFLVFIAQEIAVSLEETFSQVRGLGNDIHSHKAKHLIHIRKMHSLDFNYNILWEEVGGSLSSDGWFDLPVNYERKDGKEIKSNKRAQYRKRYEMLDDISRQIKRSLSIERNAGD